MKIHIFTLFLLFTSLFTSCKTSKSKCIYIENYSRNIRVADIDSTCSYANNLDTYAIPLFIYIDDSLPSNQLDEFYHFSGLKNQVADKHVVLFIAKRKEFNLVYSENMKHDSILSKRHDFGRFVYEELKKSESALELTNIYKKFGEIFSQK